MTEGMGGDDVSFDETNVRITGALGSQKECRQAIPPRGAFEVFLIDKAGDGREFHTELPVGH